MLKQLAQISVNYIPMLVAGMIGPLIAGGVVLHSRRAHARYRRSPLSRDLLRPAGHGITEQLSTLRDRIDQYLLELVLTPLLMLIAYLTFSKQPGVTYLNIFATLITLIALIHIGWRTCQLLGLQRRLRQLRLGLDAEMATGQELDQLMRQGAAVFHDLPADHGNIDHVVICRAGVFAVETKGRSKPQRTLVENSADVVFDGRTLSFPTWSEVRPLAQAQRQAQWLERWLSDAVGAKIPVTPVLMLPGWFVKRQGRSVVRVMNPREKHALLGGYGRSLDDALLHAVAHAVEERCRNVKPHSAKLLPA